MPDKHPPTQSLGATHPQRNGALLAAGASVWAAGFIVCWKLAQATGPRAALVLVLLLSATLASTIISLILHRGQIRLRRTDLSIAALLALFTIIGNMASITALATCSAAVVSIFLQTQIFMIAGLERVLIRHPISPMMMLGAGLAVSGCILMQADMQQDVLVANSTGLLWALLAAASFAVMLVITRRSAKSIDMPTVNMLRLWMAMVAMSAWPGVITDTIALPIDGWLYASMAGLCGLVISRLMLMYAVRFIPATTTKLISLTSPLYALGLAWLVLDEVPAWRDLAGGTIILTGVALPLVWAWHRERMATAG